MNKPLDPIAEASRNQNLAASPETTAWVTANAGSGKTKVLIDRVARLLLGGAQPDAVLCITYTKAAASEMRSRVLARLRDLLLADEQKCKADIEKLTEVAQEREREKERERDREREGR